MRYTQVAVLRPDYSFEEYIKIIILKVSDRAQATPEYL